MPPQKLALVPMHTNLGVPSPYTLNLGPHTMLQTEKMTPPDQWKGALLNFHEWETGWRCVKVWFFGEKALRSTAEDMSSPSANFQGRGLAEMSTQTGSSSGLGQASQASSQRRPRRSKAFGVSWACLFPYPSRLQGRSQSMVMQGDFAGLLEAFSLVAFSRTISCLRRPSRVLVIHGGVA
ncbi:hypothetical protein T440DRAFT_99830 [Plenodomus tracheiphilus IPT5]|uniref:Uncharacterized protein n=1 Tax=Plenodomus tracheiphilus IPT5 TaxID=1408161 RepID=A0A6A7BL63_9PLEO|nr:hypothetical protein T440DRAFT_99830 [Plenodomus tracheiphilus IPT5]